LIEGGGFNNISICNRIREDCFAKWFNALNKGDNHGTIWAERMAKLPADAHCAGGHLSSMASSNLANRSRLDPAVGAARFRLVGEARIAAANSTESSTSRP
jgi:hypothetical protein